MKFVISILISLSFCTPVTFEHLEDQELEPLMGTTSTRVAQSGTNQLDLEFANDDYAHSIQLQLPPDATNATITCFGGGMSVSNMSDIGEPFPQELTFIQNQLNIRPTATRPTQVIVVNNQSPNTMRRRVRGKTSINNRWKCSCSSKRE